MPVLEWRDEKEPFYHQPKQVGLSPKVTKDGQIKVQIWVGEADEGIFQRGRAQPCPQSCHTLYSAMVFTQHQEGLVQVTKGLAPTYLGLRWKQERREVHLWAAGSRAGYWVASELTGPRNAGLGLPRSRGRGSAQFPQCLP